METTTISNCEHINNGWCLECVSEMHVRLAAVEQQAGKLQNDFDVTFEHCESVEDACNKFADDVEHLEADKAVLLEVMKKQPAVEHDGDLYCRWCNAPEPDHQESCITQANHPGSKLLERLEAADKCIGRLQYCPVMPEYKTEKYAALEAYDEKSK